MRFVLEFLISFMFLAAGAYTITTVARIIFRSRDGHAINTAAIEERLARLEATVEGLSVETNRVVEGHRFLTQLMGDRQGQQPGRITTGTANGRGEEKPG